MLRVRSKTVCRQMLLGWMLLASASPSALAQTAPAAPPVEVQAPISPRAAEVQAALNQLLQQWATLAGTSAPLKPSGPIQITDQPDGGVRVTLPETVLADNGGHLVIPPISYTEAPAVDGRRKISIQLPNSILWRTENPQDSWVLAIGRQMIELLWLDAAVTYEKANIALGDVTVTAQGKPEAVRIGEVMLVQDLSEHAPGSWSGRQTLTLKNLQVVDPNSAETNSPTVGIGTIEASSDMVDFRLVDYASHMKAAGLDLMNPQPSPAGSEGQLTQMRRIAELGRNIPNLIGSMASTVRASNITVHAPNAPTPNFAVSAITVRWGTGGEGEGKLKVGLNFDVENVLLDGDLKPTRNADLLPHSAGIGLTLDNVPGAALWRMMLGNFDQALELQMAALREQNTVEPEPDDTGQPPTDEDIEEEDIDEETTDIAEEPSPVDEAMQSALATSAAMALPVLANHPPRLLLDRLDILGPLASAKASGSLRYNPNAQYSGDGALDITLTGLDKVIDSISKTPPKSEERDALPLLTALRGVAKAEVMDNAILHRLRVEIPVKGDITINGMSLDALMNPPKQKPQKPKK